MSSIDHLHAETEVMPVREHCEMLSQQFLLATTKPDHPNHSDIHAPPPPRLMRETLQTKFSQDIKHLIPESGSDSLSYKNGLKTLHTTNVQATILKQQNNPVLQHPAPKIDKSERTLPRKTRVTLAQLRSGYSSKLNSFLNRINPTKYPDPNCPECNHSPHTTDHLFTCQENPTDLTPISLWNNPVAASQLRTRHPGRAWLRT